MPQRTEDNAPLDPERAAYNEYLAGLAARDERTKGNITKGNITKGNKQAS